jgi:hypothetical protein
MYIIVLFLSAMIFAIATMFSAPMLDNVEAALLQAVCAALFVCVGRLLDGLEKGHAVNTIRVLGFLCLSSWLVSVAVLDNPRKRLGVRAFQVFSVVDAVTWMFAYHRANSSEVVQCKAL